MRRVLFALCLTIGVATTACSSTPTGSRERTLAAFQPFLTRNLTPPAAAKRFGSPDQVTGSGLRIYVYRIDAGRTLWLGFPGDGPIVYAKLRAPDGSLTDIALR